MNASPSLGRAALMVFAASVLFIVSDVNAADDAARDWRLSDLRKVIKDSGRNLPLIITAVTILDDTTLVVHLTSTLAPLSGVAAEATLTYTEKHGWKVIKTAFFDP